MTNDLIGREAAMKFTTPEDWETPDEKWRPESEYGKFIESLPPAQRWIPVTERLPEFDELVLVWVENKDPKGRFNRPGIHTAQLRDRKPEHDPEGKKNVWGIPGYDSEWTVWAWSHFSEPDVKAWMPLPEPYEEME